MSVLTLPPETFNYIQAGIERAAYNRTVNEFYYYPIDVHFKDKDMEKESKRLINSWADMNYKSYCYRYDEDFESIAPFIVRESTKKPLTAIQLYKYVECLCYNIEPEHWELTEQEKADLKLLQETRISIVCAIVGSLQEYKEAQWQACSSTLTQKLKT